MKVIKIFLDLEKESKWLQKMSENGYVLKRKAISYYFEKTFDVVSNAVDYRVFKNQSDFEDYVLMFKDLGWCHVAGSKKSGKQYFSKYGKDEIYSDQTSFFQMVKRHAQYWMLISLIMAITYRPHFADLLKPLKSYYLTPGLWEIEGKEFIGRFLFETPFVVFRIFANYGVVFFSSLYLMYVINLLLKYRRIKKVNI